MGFFVLCLLEIIGFNTHPPDSGGLKLIVLLTNQEWDFCPVISSDKSARCQPSNYHAGHNVGCLIVITPPIFLLLCLF